MSIIHVTNDYTENKVFTEFSYVLSGKTNMSSHTKNSVGVVLLHDKTDKTVSVEMALKEYSVFQSDTIIFAHSDGSTPSTHLQNLFPNVCFFSLGQSQPKLSKKNKKEKNMPVGTLLNMLFLEINTDLVFVSWTHINPFGISTNMLSRHVGGDAICLVPVLEDDEGNVIPTSYKASIVAGRIKILINKKAPLFPYTFLPHNFIGVFNRKQMLDLKGFDTDIGDSFWQLCDFAIRAYCADQHMRVSPYYRVRLSHKVKIATQKKNKMYERMSIKHAFFLKSWFKYKYLLQMFCVTLVFNKSNIRKAKEKVQTLQRLLKFSKTDKSTHFKNIRKKITYFF